MPTSHVCGRMHCVIHVLFPRSLAGGVRGGGDPLYFEMVAAVAHPLPAGTAGGLLTLFYHFVLAVCLLVPPAVMAWSMTAMAVCCVVSAALLLPAHVPAAAPEAAAAEAPVPDADPGQQKPGVKSVALKMTIQ
jgi:hypothetical protein